VYLVPLLEHLDDLHDRVRTEPADDVRVRARLGVEPRRPIDDEVAGLISQRVVLGDGGSSDRCRGKKEEQGKKTRGEPAAVHRH
jgi:hypothetical protein